MESYDLIVDYNELEKDDIIKIKVVNVKPASWQYSAVDLLITIANMFSPVKFSITYGK
jgi:hypothetical protein